MRYMGDTANPFQLPTGPLVPPDLSPAAKAQMLAAASQMHDKDAEFVLELADATPYGKRARMIRIGIGAGVGLLVGFLAGRALKR